MKEYKTTKKEFKKNRDQYIQDNIKSAKALQKRKNAATQELKRARKEERRKISEAYDRSIGQQHTDLTKAQVLQYYDIFQKRRAAIFKAMDRGEIPSTSPIPVIPINESGFLNFKRLDYFINKNNVGAYSIKTIKAKTLKGFLRDCRYYYSDRIYNIISRIVDNGLVKPNEVYTELAENESLNALVNYDVWAFRADNAGAQERKAKIFAEAKDAGAEVVRVLIGIAFKKKRIPWKTVKALYWEAGISTIDLVTFGLEQKVTDNTLNLNRKQWEDL